MIKEKTLKLVIIFLTICLLTIPTVQGVQNYTYKNNEYKDEKTENAGQIEHYKNSIILVIGKCDRIDGPLVWLFGFYCPLLKRNFRIIANGGENERLNAIIIGPGNFGSYFSQETLTIDIRGARGVLYNFGKSLFVNGNNIIAFCKAENIFID
jgi:hypothetical protein